MPNRPVCVPCTLNLPTRLIVSAKSRQKPHGPSLPKSATSTKLFTDELEFPASRLGGHCAPVRRHTKTTEGSLLWSVCVLAGVFFSREKTHSPALRNGVNTYYKALRLVQDKGDKLSGIGCGSGSSAGCSMSVCI